MNRKLAANVSGIVSVPITLFILLLPFSLITGWNIVTVLLYWFLIVPFAAEYIPTVFFNEKNQLVRSVIGTIIYYSFMLFLSRAYYQSDLYQVMAISALINAGSIVLISKIKKVYREPVY